MNTPAPIPQPCLEVAVFSARSDRRIPAVQRRIHQRLTALAGFESSLPLQKLGEPTRRADLVRWRSAAEAEVAARALPSLPEFAELFAEIETLHHMAHYVGDSPVGLEHFGEAPVIEIAAYRAQDLERVRALRPRIHGALTGTAGALFSWPGSRTTDDDAFLDLIAWPDAQAFENAPNAMGTKHPELTAFFSLVEVAILELYGVATP